MKKFNWEKLGLVYKPNGENQELISHASMPFAKQLSGSVYRVYFSSRNAKNNSFIHYLEIDLNQINSIKKLSNTYLIGKSEYGFFDDNGLYSGPLVEKDDKLYMFYSGRSNGVENLFYMNIGLLVSEDNGLSFKRVFKSPVLTRSEYDPWLVTAPCVYKIENTWYMIYTSGTKIYNNGNSNYDLKLAKSDDFFTWKQTGKTVIPLNDDENNLSTSAIIKIGETYHLWFSVKPKIGEYRIGYAYSTNGFDWTRNDEIGGLEISSEGWDSEALSYPSVFIHENNLYMLYSGNKNGRDGIGLAKCKID